MRGHILNKIANELFTNDAEFKAYIKTTATNQIRRRKADYSALSIFDKEDLEQEIWCSLFESNCQDKESLKKRAIDFSENFASKGHRKRGYNDVTEIPVSQLPDAERQMVENLFYSGGDFDDELG
jgi:hypothetical protein